MKKFTLNWVLLIAVVFFFWACQKEGSVEGNGFKGTAQGSLTDSSGICMNTFVRGDYVVDEALTDSNYIIVQVNFTLQGKYHIYSDTVNGMWFVDSGYALTTGASIIKLKGHGKPILPTRSDFVMTFNNNYCAFSITTGTTGSAGSNDDYFPNTLHSNWTYEYIPLLGTIDTFRVTVTGNPSIFFDNRLFKEYSTDPLGEPYYFSKDNAGNYYALSTIDFDYLFIFDAIPNSFISYPFLKDNVPVGTSWETAEYGTVKVAAEEGVSKAKFTIMEKDITYSVLGNSYSNVINVKREILFKPTGSGSFRILLEGNTYYAKGIGMIDQVVPAKNQSVSLRRKEVF